MGDGEITLEVQGLKELQEALKKLPDAAATKSLAVAVTAGAEVVYKACGTRIHDRTGELRRRLRKRLLEADRAHALVSVLNGAPHAHLVEMGHAMVRPGGKQIGMVPPYPFMRPGFDESAEAAVGAMRDKLGQQIDEAWDTLRVSQQGAVADPPAAGE